jgi:hypothetical protein
MINTDSGQANKQRCSAKCIRLVSTTRKNWGKDLAFGDCRKPDIEYPCQWEYKVISNDQYLARRAIDEVLDDTDAEVDFGNMSRTGKYCSLAVVVTVEDEESRVAIFHQLRNHEDIIMVL